MQPSVVLLNPPGSRAWLRDGYCSLEGRWAYRFFPMDLLVQSGLLRGKADVTVVDAIGGALDADRALSAVRDAHPDLVLSLVGSTSRDEDAAFLGRVRDACPDARIVVSGDLPQFEATGLDAFPAADAALLDFSAPDLLTALDGGGSATWWRGRPRPPRARQGGSFAYGLPDYDAFPWRGYRLPYRPGRIGSPLSSFGCPFPCRFCNTSQVSWKTRDVDDLAAELRWLSDHGVRHSYIRDATFGADRTHRAAVLQVLRNLPRPMTWNSFTRIDLFERKDLRELARSGCVVLQLGLELPDEATLKSLHKPLRASKVRERIAWARQEGIAVCGHFLLGVPGARALTGLQVVDYAVAVGCDYASFNVATARPGAPFRDQQGFLPPDPARRLQARAMRRFYGHPAVVLRQLRRLRSPAEVLHSLRQAGSLVVPSPR